MTEQLMKQIKKVLKKENVEVEATYYGRNTEFRVKVISFVDRSGYEGAKITLTPMVVRNKMTQDRIIKVLRALSKNGLRPEYRTEQRENTDNYGTFDCRYIIFK